MGRLRLMFLQACEARDAIRHAIIALGALDMTSRVRSQGNVRDAARRDAVHPVEDRGVLAAHRARRGRRRQDGAQYAGHRRQAFLAHASLQR